MSTGKSPTIEGRPLLIFDGECGFCSVSANFIVRRIRPRATVVPWQNLNLAPLGLSPKECTEAVQWVNPDGSLLSGNRAIMAMLRTAPALWPVIGWVGDLPGINVLARVVYQWIADHRELMPGSTPACAVERAG